ncbi:Dynein heavy chain 10, axonemal [Frankliniella fusca]|uniref:Dynein heavy chain 10, axonemal n=1 Tax=Frankliniella fusca TaxID=407009 RepID=A0AAE1HFY6_9NEOP|nr:Dynein heavy chain 10, axonemal [Frankliniella fusca]
MESRSTRYRLRKRANGLVIRENLDDSDVSDDAEPPEAFRFRPDPEVEELQHQDVYNNIHGSPNQQYDNDGVVPAGDEEAQDVGDVVGNLRDPNHDIVENYVAGDDDVEGVANNIEGDLNYDIIDNLVPGGEDADVNNPECNLNLPNNGIVENLCAQEAEGDDEDSDVSLNSEASSESEQENAFTDDDDDDGYNDYEAQAGQPPLQDHFNDDRPLYPNAQVTLRESVIAIVTFALTHHLTGFYEDLQFRFNRVKKNPNNIEDLYDGNIYKENFQSGFLSNPNNISFMWYTDGVSTFNISNKFSIWPLYLVVNELSYKKRVKKENIILAGLWFGKKKPKANTFLQPFHTKMVDFYQNGHIFNRPDGHPILVKGVVLCGTCDMPAKSTFLRIKQFNGFYSCPRCLQRGEQYAGTTVHVYSYDPNAPLRSNDSVEEHGKVAIASGFACYGVKGISLLYRMVSNLVRSTGIDSMHGIFSGQGKALLHYWFSSDHKDSDFSLHHLVDNVNARLKQFKVPSFLNKFPQSVSDLSSWKSLDFKVWLLCYSIPVLSGLMSDLYLDHHMLLVSGVFILSQQSISPEQINQASVLLSKYVSEFETLYDLRFMGINVHQLTHLAQCVEDLGPLWVYSCYFMEDLNGKICKFIHGTSHVGVQIASATTKVQQLECLISSLNHVSPAHSFCNRVHKLGQNFKVAEVISPGIHVVGKFSHLLVPPRQLLLDCLNIQGGHCQLFSRLWLKGTLYVSESYTRAEKRQSSHVQFTLDDTSSVGSIKYFIRWSNCHCTTLCYCQPGFYLCVIQVYKRIAWRAHMHPDNLAFSYMHAVRDTADLVIVPVSSLQSLCFYLSVTDGIDTHQYIIQRVNNLEVE